MSCRIHITGASGTGTSTLARALATRLASQAFDTDDFYWCPTDPPFSTPRLIRDRLQLMEDMFLPRSDWVLSGSLHSWGAPVMARVTHVVFLTLDASHRLQRLRARERQRFGARISPGGDMEADHRGFLEWAMAYDDADNPGRSRAVHEAWLTTLNQPVLRFEADARPDALVSSILAVLDAERLAG